MLRLMKSNVHTNYKKATICISELILTPFSPFDIKCKKNLMQTGIIQKKSASGGQMLPCLVILFQILFWSENAKNGV